MRLFKNLVLGVCALFFFGVISYWLLMYDRPFGLEGWMVKKFLVQCADKLFKEWLFNPIFYVAVTIILIIERMFPVKADQKTFSVGFLQDSVYILVDIVFSILVLSTFVHFLKTLYNQHFSFLTVETISRWPAGAVIVFGFFVTDFLDWFHHWIRHKVPWFWQLHTIHHSQREMNLFTDMRYHFVEYVIAKCISVFPLMILGLGTSTIIYLELSKMWYTHMYHANIKSNFGFLKYVLVTPQSHRVHHSREHQHQDKNFGVILSVWDHLLGTQHLNYNEYPDTGIQDDHFPLEKKVQGLSLLINPVLQLVYPFFKIGKSVKKRTISLFTKGV